MTLQKNPYHNPMLNDGDLLLRLEYLRTEWNNSTENLSYLMESFVPIQDVESCYQYCLKVRTELLLVLEALEGNSYDSWLGNIS
ncbi:hypothetical protein [Vibrio vulnificus]|uniref:hypothetical protein n=1 Tax=Vibrio vulnificus TaxID=672 RepID=UPI000D3EAFCA|nr:hypothetical protein [Vibrio vulnificus]MBN8142962.1 hypothetical protein [Vibrio vulnificus]MBN8152230.1 hypothetical protein [Vibrio vulnificus]NIG89973.1 hypothetical protein [Vibrio vulnificus]PUZ79039.1 hypothetical protein DC357_21425 [Vibrio vulnificus]